MTRRGEITDHDLEICNWFDDHVAEPLVIIKSALRIEIRSPIFKVSTLTIQGQRCVDNLIGLLFIRKKVITT